MKQKRHIPLFEIPTFKGSLQVKKKVNCLHGEKNPFCGFFLLFGKINGILKIYIYLFHHVKSPPEVSALYTRKPCIPRLLNYY